MKYRVHQFKIKMTEDQTRLEEFLNKLKGEVVSIIPNVTPGILGLPVVNLLLIVEKTN